MLKKIYTILALLLTTVILISCGGGSKEVQLPVLNGQTRSEITNTLTELGATFTIEEEINLNITADTFIRYGNGLSAGMMVNLKDTELVVVVAVHKYILPDMTGQTEAQATRTLQNLGLLISVTYRDSTDHPEGTVIGYGGTFHVGQEVQQGSRIAVVIARYPGEYRSPIFISKYVSSTGFNRAIEIHNSMEEEVNLSGYTLSFYLDGDPDVTNSYTLPEGTSLNGKDTLLLVHPNADAILIEKADILTNELTFVGKDYITLTDHKNSLIDKFGLYQVYVMNFNNRIMVRNEQTYQSNLEFVQAEWDIYHHLHYEILDSHPTHFPDTFTFLPEDLALEGGYDVPRGMVKVDFVYANDGDTAYFEPHFMADKRIRFVGINAPEMTPSPEPHAQAATTFLNNLLGSATDIYIQQDPYAGIHDTYERRLGLVWADGQLANYLMVLNGYSRNYYTDPEVNFIYNGVTLNEWFRRAESKAQALQLGIWS